MAKKKIVTTSEEVTEVEVVPTQIQYVSVDFGREDINNLGKTINQIIDVINKK